MNELEGNDHIDRVRILDACTLELVDEINMHRFDSIHKEDLVEANLLWGSNYLYIQTRATAFFMNIKERKMEFQFEMDNDDDD